MCLHWRTPFTITSHPVALAGLYDDGTGSAKPFNQRGDGGLFARGQPFRSAAQLASPESNAIAAGMHRTVEALRPFAEVTHYMVEALRPYSEDLKKLDENERMAKLILELGLCRTENRGLILPTSR